MMMRNCCVLALGVSIVAALASPVVAGGGEVDLRDGADVIIVGADEHDAAGYASGGAGDVNGDGVPDLLVSSCLSPQDHRAGATFVVFGIKDERRRVELDGSEGDYGFRIDGADRESFACTAESAGDVNGDGLDDIAIGASGADNRGADSGSVYVVFGKKTTSPVSLALFDLGIQGDLGFRIDGPGAITFTGLGVAGVGDMNHDGLDDILVGSPWAGSSYVVFGRDSSTRVDLRTFHSDSIRDGVRISHPQPDSSSGFGVGAVGDVNDDGILDVAVGVSQRDYHPGTVYVVFGVRSPQQIDARRLGKRGFSITGVRSEDLTGTALDGAGDVNGDGIADLIVGAPRYNEIDGRGNAYVVFGQSQPRSLQLSELGGRGFRIRGMHRHDAAGLAVAGAGDVNGDGLDDVLVGVPSARHPERGSPAFADAPGAAFVVYGKRKIDIVELASIGGEGYRVKGAEGKPEQCEQGVSTPQTGPLISYFCHGDAAGASVAPAGDVNDDGLADIVVGAPFAGDPYPGHTYVIWSHPFRPSR